MAEPPDPDRLQVAAEILAGLRREDARLILSARDLAHLAPTVSLWLARGVEEDGVRRALTGQLPQGPLRRPAGLLAYRLTALLPPPLPEVPPAASRPDPLQNCDRGHRAPEPGLCRDCRPSEEAARAAA